MGPARSQLEHTAMIAEWHLPRVRAVVGATADAEVLALSEAVDHADGGQRAGVEFSRGDLDDVLMIGVCGGGRNAEIRRGHAEPTELGFTPALQPP